MSFVNNGQDPNGRWEVHVRDLRAGVSGQLQFITLGFEADPTPGEVTGPWATDNSAACACPDQSDDCLLLPDLIILEAFTRQQIKEYPPDHEYYPRHLRFATSIANVGAGPLETRGTRQWYCGEIIVDQEQRCPDGSRPRQPLVQRLYQLEGTKIKSADVAAGTNYYDEKPGHGHYHVDNWVVFRLRRKKCNGNPGKVIAEGDKVSFCLFDSGICNNEDGLCTWGDQVYGEDNLPNYGFGGYRDCEAEYQGISVGGYDTYGLHYEGQYLEIPPGTKNGEYWLEIEIDPDHKFRESKRDNNVFRHLITLNEQY